MSHLTLKKGYESLVERLNRFPQGAPRSGRLYQILEMLFSPQEAELVSVLPLKPFSAEKAAGRWNKDIAAARKILDRLAGRAILLDVEHDGEAVYALPPPMAGFFEFSLMRVGGKIDQKVLAKLFYEYLNVEEDFIKDLFTRGETQLGRVFVQERALGRENAAIVLDYERATEVIESSPKIGIGTCYCRHKMQHVGKDCDADKEICMTFNTSAASLIKHGYAREASVSECMELLCRAYEQNLVQFGDNVRERVNFICNCCGCCCEAMIAARKFALLHPVHTTNFIPETGGSCTGCGKCVDVCPVEAMALVSANDPGKPRRKSARLDREICLGCGVCVRNCPEEALFLLPREERVITPLNSAHRTVLMAIERGTLQHLLFDNRLMWSHRAMAAILGVILKLGPVKRAMASRQMKSRYLETLCAVLDV